MEGSATRRTQPNPHELPDDYPIEWLVEAKQLYRHELPPFVEPNRGNCTAGLRRNVTLRVTEGQQQGLPVEAELTCWSWNRYFTFCTVDIGGRRLIVKGNSSDRYCSYRSWLGPVRGFSYQPVAFGPWQIDPEASERPKLGLRTQHEYHYQTLSNPHYIPTRPDSRVQQTSMRDHDATQPARRPSNGPVTSPSSSSSVGPANLSPRCGPRQQDAQEQQHYINAGHSVSPSTKDIPRPMQARNGDVQVPIATEHRDSQHYVRTSIEGPSSGPRPDVSSPEGHEARSPARSCEFVQESPSQDLSNAPLEIAEDQDLDFELNDDSATATRGQPYASIERSGKRAVSREPYGDNADALTAHKPQDQAQRSTEPNSLIRPRKRRRKLSIPNPHTSTSPQLSAAMPSPSTRSSPQPTPSTSSHDPSRFPTPTSSNPHSSSSSSPLAPHKQSRTTLFIAIPLSTDTVPLKLRSCMSLPSLFAAVLAICPHPGQDAVSGIRATFDWKREGEVDRAILLKRDLEDTFEVLLEIVDGAPCWREEGGRCGVAVEVVLV